MPEIEIISIQADILGEVVEFLFHVVFARHIPSGIIRRNDISVVVNEFF